MTQAYNLAILANAVDTSGRLNVGTNATGVLPVANGGTGLSSTPTNGQLNIGNGSGFTRATLTAGSGISITNGAGSITIASSGGAGTVTSVATGNGLQGGTITSTGTLSLGSVAANTVGSYIFAYFWGYNGNFFNPSYGGTYAGGGGGNANTIWLATGSYNPGGCSPSWVWGNGGNNISGTWRWMGGPKNSTTHYDAIAIAVRIS